MRTYRRLFEQIVSPANLQRACTRAARGKRHRESVAWYLLRQEHHLVALNASLLADTWQPTRCGLQLIYEPKPRAITIGSFENNVVHHALVDVIEPLLGRSYLPDSYACLEGRGAHRAVLAHQGYQRRFRFLLQLDIAKYFPSISHERLLELLARRIQDARVIRLLARILEADDGLYLRPEVLAHLNDPAYIGKQGVGLPVGTLTSQFFGNFFLSDLDHFIKRELKIPGLCRYMDNVTCFADSRAQLREVEAAIRQWLEAERGLRLKDRRDALRASHARILYLGYHITRDARTPGPLLFYRLRRRLDHLRLSGLTDRRLKTLRRSLESYRSLVAF